MSSASSHTMNGITQDESSTNGHGPIPEQNDAPPTEAEVQSIIQSIKDASTPQPHTSPATPEFDPPIQDEFDEGAYWDLSSMAPLNAVSAVSSFSINTYNRQHEMLPHNLHLLSLRQDPSPHHIITPHQGRHSTFARLPTATVSAVG